MKYKIRLHDGWYSLIEFESETNLDFEDITTSDEVIQAIMDAEAQGKVKNAIFYMKDEYENFTVYREA